MKEDFLQVIDSNLQSMGFGDRAAFIRTAVLEKLANEGFPQPASMTAPPSRAGKGGRPSQAQAQASATLNESKEPDVSPKLPAKAVKNPAVKKKPKAP